MYGTPKSMKVVIAGTAFTPTVQSSINLILYYRNVSVTERVFFNSYGRSSQMPRPNTDPLLQPPARERKSTASPVNDTHERKNIDKAADTLFKGTPPPNSKRIRREKPRDQRS
jgi:hypothetical protein